MARKWASDSAKATVKWASSRKPRGFAALAAQAGKEAAGWGACAALYAETASHRGKAFRERWDEAKQSSQRVERVSQAILLRDIFGNPFRPVALSPGWRTSDVLALAEGIYADRAFDRLPILADALMDAGCDSADILAHCRADGPHVRGCWVVDAVLGKE